MISFPVFFSKTISKATYPLSPEGIDLSIEEGDEYLESNNSLKLDKTLQTKFRMILENILLFHMESSIGYDTFTVKLYKKFNNRYVCIEIPGPKSELKEAAGDGLEYINTIVSSICGNDINVAYSYSNGANVYALKLPSKKKNSVIYTVWAFGAAILTGLICSYLPPETVQLINGELFSPIFHLCTGLLGLVSILMIFFSILTGVCKIGDINSLSQRGSTTLGSFVFGTFLETVLATVICLLLFNFVSFNNAAGFAVFIDLLHSIISMVPTNPVKPFVDGNSMHVLFLAIGTGILILMNSERAKPLVDIIVRLNLITMTGVAQVCRLTPLIVYLSISMMCLGGTLSAVLGTWKILVITVVLYIAEVILFYVYASVKLKCSFSKILKDAMPVGIVGISTGSTAACFTKLTELCETAYNIKADRVGFYFPILQIFFKATAVGFLTVFIYVMCDTYGITMDITTVIINTIVFTLMRITVAPVAGGAIPVVIVLLNSINLPTESVAIYTSICVVVDMFGAGMRMFIAPSLIAIIDKKINSQRNSFI